MTFIAYAAKMYLDETTYELPSTGWPSITSDSMRPFDKTDEVVELLRHLPYPSDEDPDRRPGSCRANERGVGARLSGLYIHLDGA